MEAELFYTQQVPSYTVRYCLQPRGDGSVIKRTKQEDFKSLGTMSGLHSDYQAIIYRVASWAARDTQLEPVSNRQKQKQRKL